MICCARSFYISDLDLAYLGVACLGMALPWCDLPGLGVVFLGVMILKLILSTFQSSDLFVVHEEGIVFLHFRPACRGRGLACLGVVCLGVALPGLHTADLGYKIILL